MADEKAARRAALNEQIAVLDGTMRTHEEGRRLGRPGYGEPFQMRQLHGEREKLVKELQQLDEGGEGGEA